MKILMIEDEQDDIAGIIDYCKDNEWEYDVKSFDESLYRIEEYDPDIIILDLQNKEDSDFPGVSIINLIWDKSFRPICVFFRANC